MSVVLLLLMTFLPATSTGDFNVVTGGCTSPSTLPRFALPIDLANTAVVSDRDLRGRPAVLVFFSPIQKASVRAVAISQKMFFRFHRQGLVVLGFEVDESPNANRDLKPTEHDPISSRHKFGLGFPVARDCCGAQSVFCVSKVPTVFFADRRGKMWEIPPGKITATSLQQSVRAILKR